MPDVSLKLTIGSFSVEVRGPAKYAEKKLEDLVGRYLSSSVKPVGETTSSAASTLQAPAGKRRSAGELLKRTHANQTDSALLLGYYMEKTDNRSNFTTTELGDLGRQAKRPFTNISDNVARLVGRGLMMSAGERDGQRAYALTATGEEYAESLLSNP